MNRSSPAGIHGQDTCQIEVKYTGIYLLWNQQERQIAGWLPNGSPSTTPQLSQCPERQWENKINFNIYCKKNVWSTPRENFSLSRLIIIFKASVKLNMCELKYPIHYGQYKFSRWHYVKRNHTNYLPST